MLLEFIENNLRLLNFMNFKQRIAIVVAQSQFLPRIGSFLTNFNQF